MNPAVKDDKPVPDDTKENAPVERQAEAKPMNKVDALKMMIGQSLFNPKPRAQPVESIQTKKKDLKPLSALERLTNLLQETLLDRRTDETTTTTETPKDEVLEVEDPTSELSFIERMTKFVAKKMYGIVAGNDVVAGNDEVTTAAGYDEVIPTTEMTPTKEVSQPHKDPMSDLDNALDKLKNLFHSELKIGSKTSDVIENPKTEESTKETETEDRSDEPEIEPRPESQPDQV